VAERRHDLGGEEPQRRQHLRLRDRLRRVEQEVDPVDADGLPLLDDLDDARRITDGEPFGSPGPEDSWRSAGSRPSDGYERVG
jgi:hypothetical protein